jgi:uncharacterized repeat protein (TIGR01451 family)
MKRRAGLVGAVALGLFTGLWLAVQAQNNDQGGRIDAFTFFIPYEADRLDEQFNVGQSTQDLTNVDIVSIISIAVDRGNNIIYYDNWEDDLETNLTNPVQPSTWVWGDGDPSNNGPGNTVQGIPANDILRDGDVITLRNTVTLPRDRANLFFDGGDVLTSVGGAIAVSVTFWSDTAENGPGVLFTDAWELYPTSRWGTDYIIPIGENLVPANDDPSQLGPNQRLGFRVVGINIQAVRNNTTVQIGLNADGDFEDEVSLNEGEQFNRVGTRDGIGPESVLAGARVRASAPVQVHIFAANPASTYEARGYTIVPANQWTNDYLAPRSSDGDFWLYNPNDSDLEVRVETAITGPVTINIPLRSTIKYPETGLMTAATAIRFTATDGRPFTGLVALDATDEQDWGYALLPFNRLGTQVLIGLGLGNENVPPDGNQSRVYVAAVNRTTIFVDYDNDGNPDRSVDVDPLAEVDIRDPDNDMTGAFLYTEDGTPFAAVWGQDEGAPKGFPSIDAGTGIVPLPSLLIQKTFRLSEDADCNGTVTRDDAVQFRLQYFNNTANPIRGLIISDTLPPEVTYIPNTTLLNGVPIADSSSGTPLVLDEGGYAVGDIPRFGTGNITFNVRINDASHTIINQADAVSQDFPLGSDLVFVFTVAQAIPPVVQIAATLVDPADGVVTTSQPITVSLTITNTSSGVITRLPVEQGFDQSQLAFLGAAPAPNLATTGVITWTDLTDIVGDLPPGGTTSVTINYQVVQLPAVGIPIVLTSTVVEARQADIQTRLICRNTTAFNLTTTPPTPTPAPSPTPTVTATPTRTPPPPGQPTPGPTPTPVTVTVIVPVSPTPVLPVALLPETGLRETAPPSQTGWGVLLLVAGLPGSLLALYLWRQRHRGVRS